MGQQKCSRLQGRLLHKDGRWLWWHGQMQLVRKEQVTGLLGVILLSGENPLPKQALLDMRLTGFPSNITPGELTSITFWPVTRKH